MKASLPRKLLVLSITIVILLGAAPAQEVGGSNLKLATTTIKANNQPLSLSSTQVAAFSPTELTCPASHTKGCSIRVEVSSQFSNVVKGANAQLDVSINGNLFPVSPASLVDVARGVGTAENEGGPSASTFDWVVLGVTAGAQVEIDIDADVTSGAASAGDRTATIQLYLD